MSENTNFEPVLVILAAGMGSRYGGLKQIDTVGSQGESIIDFSIYDAYEAGFKKVMLIIQEQHEQAFEDSLGKQVREFMEVEYAYQSLDDIPEGYAIPEGREKPWGTTHALLSIRKQIDAPFIIINADDYYGKQSFKIAYDYLKNDITDKEFALVGYDVLNTLSDSGSVTRGYCEEQEGYLTNIVEIQEIIKKDGEAFYKDGEDYQKMPDNSLVSMNFWAFTPKVIDYLQEQFVEFLNHDVKENPLKAEALLPNDVGAMMEKHGVKVRVLDSQEEWFGVTYADDKPKVVKKIQDLKDAGAYPEYLWKK